MIIGSKDDFAVEFELNENYGGAWLFGKICYWVNNLQIGDYNSGTSLRDVLFQMKYIYSDCGSRHSKLLCDLNYEQAFHLLDSALYDANGNSEEDSFARFNVGIPVDVFDDWKIFLVDCIDKAELIFKSRESDKVNVFFLTVGKFDGIIKKVYEELDDLYEKIKSKEHN